MISFAFGYKVAATKKGLPRVWRGFADDSNIGKLSAGECGVRSKKEKVGGVFRSLAAIGGKGKLLVKYKMQKAGCHRPLNSFHKVEWLNYFD